MPKLLHGTLLYWHLALDSFIIQLFAIYFSSIHRFDLAAAVAIIDSALKILFTLPLAAASTRILSSTRVNLCIYLRPTLTAFWLVALLFIDASLSTTALLAIFVAFKILTNIDFALSSDFNFIAKDVHKIDFSQINSIQNIIARGSITLATAFSLGVIHRTIDIGYILFCALLATSISTISLISIKQPINQKESYISNKINPTSMTSSVVTIIKNTHMRWGLIYQIFVNFSFGGMSYMMITRIDQSSNSVLNSLTTMYGCFFAYSTLVSILGDKAILARRLIHIPQIVAATAALSIVLAASPSFAIELIVCAALGLLYAYELATVQKVLTPKLRGSAYIEYSALTKMSGRAASAISIALLGTCMQMGIPSTVLFFACGISGLVCAVALSASNPDINRDCSVLR
ncbi:hypothetical protein [Trinickia sp.]|uniref:hypothetical protein n=1 Tax=Trinickia sp. TaxID=2571163 RepID=UPI003F80980C